jgi:hypothetical protein
MSEYGKIHTDGSRSGGQPSDDSIEAKALALINEERAKTNNIPLSWVQVHYGATAKALCRAIEQHEAYKQKVSDKLEFWMNPNHQSWEEFDQFIIPKPKPDPLVEVAKSLGVHKPAAQHWAGDVRAALDALGFEIREKGQ